MTSPQVSEPKIPQIEGLRLIERVDDAGSGEVWRARITGGLGGERGDRVPGELPGVGECVLRLLRLPVDEAARARAKELAGDLLTLDDPGLVAIRWVSSTYDGLALVFAPIPSPVTPLHLLARRRQLSGGEVVTLGVALAWALAAGHRAGITHGRLRDADVLLDVAGRPQLNGIGVLGVLGASALPAADVAALERLLASLLDSGSRGAQEVLVVLAERSLTAAELAAGLAAATPALPIDVADPGAPGEPADLGEPAHGRRWGPRGARVRRLLSTRRPRTLLAAGALGIVALAAVAGWVSAAGAPPARATGQPASPAQPDRPDWTAILTRLDAARAAVFAKPGGPSLAGVDAPGTPAFDYDTAAVTTLRARGAHAVGLRMVLGEVRMTAGDSRVVTLRVTDQRPAYEIRDSRNVLLSRVAGRDSARHVIELRSVASRRSGAVQGSADDQWRIARVTDAPTGR